MKAKKVYEFINPKTDEYELEDTIPLGPKVLKLEEVKKLIIKDHNLNLDDIEIKILNNNIVYLKSNYINFTLSTYYPRISLKGRLIIEEFNGTKSWYLNGERHREDGPAIERIDGDKLYYINGKKHREDGPAIIRGGGTKLWYLNDKLHREDGPAIEWSDGHKEWYLIDEEYSRKKYYQIMNNK